MPAGGRGCQKWPRGNPRPYVIRSHRKNLLSKISPTPPRSIDDNEISQPPFDAVSSFTTSPIHTTEPSRCLFLTFLPISSGRSPATTTPTWSSATQEVVSSSPATLSTWRTRTPASTPDTSTRRPSVSLPRVTRASTSSPRPRPPPSPQRTPTSAPSAPTTARPTGTLPLPPPSPDTAPISEKPLSPAPPPSADPSDL